MKAKKGDKDFNATPLNLKRGLVTAILVVSVLVMFTAGASAATHTVCAEGCDYTSITAAEAASSSYDTIIVHDGTYTENVDVDVAHLTIRSQNGADSTTVQAASSSDHVFYVNANYVNISGFTATGATANWRAGIYLYWYLDHCNFSDNNVSNNYIGIWLMSNSTNNELTNNIANSNTHCGIALETNSTNNELTSNTANSNKHGIILGNADDNNVTCNWVAHNEQRGFYLAGGSTGNNISYNNIMHNGVHQGGDIYEWQFYNDQSDDVEAKSNFWGYGVNDSEINASIFDWQDDPSNCGNVTFIPKLSGPDPCAPIPEAATIILFSIGLLVLAGYLGVRRKD